MALAAGGLVGVAAAVDGGPVADGPSTEGRRLRAGGEATADGGWTGCRSRDGVRRGGGKAAVDGGLAAGWPSMEGRRRRAVDGGQANDTTIN